MGIDKVAIFMPISHTNRTKATQTDSAISRPAALRPGLPEKHQDEQFSFLMAEDLVEKHNIAWRVELARDEAANPLMEPEFPWESAARHSLDASHAEHLSLSRFPANQHIN